MDVCEPDSRRTASIDRRGLDKSLVCARCQLSTQWLLLLWLGPPSIISFSLRTVASMTSWRRADPLGALSQSSASLAVGLCRMACDSVVGARYSSIRDTLTLWTRPSRVRHQYSSWQLYRSQRSMWCICGSVILQAGHGTSSFCSFCHFLPTASIASPLRELRHAAQARTTR